MYRRRKGQKDVSIWRVWILFLVVGVLYGCASGPPMTTNHDASEGITTYKTRAITLSGINIGSGYGSGAQVQVRALASCSGEECKPGEVVLVFQVSGSSELRMENRSVELTADGDTYRSKRQRREINQYLSDIDRATGNVATIELSFDAFRRIAIAEEFSGSLGSSRFTLSYESRSPFRALVKKVPEGPQPT